MKKSSEVLEGASNLRKGAIDDDRQKRRFEAAPRGSGTSTPIICYAPLISPATTL